jgi:hypothetical protein
MPDTPRGVVEQHRRDDNQILSPSAIMRKYARHRFDYLFRKTKGNTPAGLTERTIAFRELMWTSAANAAPDSRRRRLTRVAHDANELNEIIKVLFDFRNAVGIPRRGMCPVLPFRRWDSLFDGQQNHSSLTA